MAKLILVRHGKSEWNEKGLWTGKTDIGLTDAGKAEAKEAGTLICDIGVDDAHISCLKRTKETLEEIKKAIGKDDIPTSENTALDERDYGVYTGKNKWEVQQQIGEAAFHNLRRGWDVPVPEGETLKDVHDRVVPYYEGQIKEELKAGKNVLVVAHGNSLRALIKHLEGLSEAQVCELELGTGEVHCYDVDQQGQVTGKEIRGKKQNQGY